jgi:hypothetical protein
MTNTMQWIPLYVGLQLSIPFLLPYWCPKCLSRTSFFKSFNLCSSHRPGSQVLRPYKHTVMDYTYVRRLGSSDLLPGHLTVYIRTLGHHTNWRPETAYEPFAVFLITWPTQTWYSSWDWWLQCLPKRLEQLNNDIAQIRKSNAYCEHHRCRSLRTRRA